MECFGREIMVALDDLGSVAFREDDTVQIAFVTENPSEG